MRKFRANFTKLRKLPLAERLIVEATNDTKWGPTSTELNKISHLTYDYHSTDLQLIYKRLHKNLTKSDLPIIILKSLTVLNYLLINGSNEFIKLVKSNNLIYSIKSLINYENSNNESSSSIRKKSTDLIELLTNPDKLKSKRIEFKTLRLEMKLPTPRSSLDLPNGGIGSVNGTRLTKSLEINRNDLFNSANFDLASSDDDSSTHNYTTEKVKLSNIVEEDYSSISRQTTNNQNNEYQKVSYPSRSVSTSKTSGLRRYVDDDGGDNKYHIKELNRSASVPLSKVSINKPFRDRL